MHKKDPAASVNNTTCTLSTLDAPYRPLGTLSDAYCALSPLRGDKSPLRAAEGPGGNQREREGTKGHRAALKALKPGAR